MILLIAGATHTGKTLLALKLLEKTGYPYLSIDHLKMGLIRSRNTDLTPEDDDQLTEYLWPILGEIIRTAVENSQNLILEGCYIPFDWRSSFSPEELRSIRAIWLVMTPDYIRKHFRKIESYGCVIEQRLDNHIDPEQLAAENSHILAECRKNGCRYILINETYPDDLPLRVLAAVRPREDQADRIS